MSPDEPFDALSGLAPLLRVHPELDSLCRFGAQWVSPHPSETSGWAPFHLVTQGACALDMRGAEPVTLGAGDIALLPHGDAHVVRGPGTARGAAATAPVSVRTTSAIQIKSDIDAPAAELICGRLIFEQAHDNFARAALPPLIVMRTGDDAASSRLGELLAAIREELGAARPGARAISCGLASALLMMVLRAHFERDPTRHGLLRLMGRRQTARALAAMLDDPGRSWSLDDIAACARTSRATLVRDFRRLAGIAPLGLLAELRLGLARQGLSRSDRPLADIAFEAGYRSQSAFSRAFQRRFHVTPGEMRQGGA